MIEFRKLNKENAAKVIGEIENLSPAAFGALEDQWKNNKVEGFDLCYKDLREKIIDVFNKYKSVGDYETDIRVGLCLYAELNNEAYFDHLKAYDDDVWRYISCIVFPDITHLRYPPGKKEQSEGHRLNHQRFYLKTRRIWLKTLWWYVHLSWQGDENSTYEVLRKCSTDNISDLIERTGRGYRLETYRELMKKFSQAEDRRTKTFNSLQMQNIVNCRTIEPKLSKGQEPGYIERLFDQLSVK